jgi:hypothetical protein
MLVPVYCALLVTSLPVLGLVGCLIALGAWYAASDGVLAGLGSSLLFGLLWTVAGITVASLTFVGLLIASALCSILLLRAPKEPVRG